MRKTAGVPVGVLLGLLCATLAAEPPAGSAATSGESEAGPERFVLMIEPSLLRPPVSRPIPGAKETLLVAGHETEFGGLEYYDAKAFEALGVDWDGFLERARRSADRVMATLVPEYDRDGRGVIEYAVLRSKNPRTAGVILGKRFRETFRKTLGENLVVLIPDRFTVFVFPKVGSNYSGYGASIVERYEDATYPVSVEVLEIDRTGRLQATAAFARSQK